MLNYNNKAFIQFSQCLDFQTGHFRENNSNFDQNVAFFYLGTLALNIKPSAFGKKSFRIKVLIYMHIGIIDFKKCIFFIYVVIAF